MPNCAKHHISVHGFVMHELPNSTRCPSSHNQVCKIYSGRLIQLVWYFFLWPFLRHKRNHNLFDALVCLRTSMRYWSLTEKSQLPFNRQHVVSFLDCRKTKRNSHKLSLPVYLQFSNEPEIRNFFVQHWHLKSYLALSENTLIPFKTNFHQN